MRFEAVFVGDAEPCILYIGQAKFAALELAKSQAPSTDAKKAASSVIDAKFPKLNRNAPRQPDIAEAYLEELALLHVRTLTRLASHKRHHTHSSSKQASAATCLLCGKSSLCTRCWT